jgi:uncharacterized membrane protein YhiD involved in acid resistance
MAPRRRSLWLAAWLASLLLAGTLPAQDVAANKLGANQPVKAPGLKEALEQLIDHRTLPEILAGLVLAAVLAVVIAYHPKSYGKTASLEEVEQPKTFIMYAVVGALVAKVVLANPDMALVIFGIGGLLRFRTDVGAAKDTGRVILVTIIGLLCGLNLFQHAVVGTAFGWIVIYFLESRAVFRIVVKGLETQNLTQAAQAYHDVLAAKGARILSEKKNFAKGQVAFVFRAPAKVSREDLEQAFLEVRAELQGAVDWEAT